MGFAKRMEIISDIVGNTAKLAQRAGLNPKTVWSYIKDGRDPSRTNLVSLARAAEVDLRWLATGEGPMTREESKGEKKSFDKRLYELQNDYPHMEIYAKPRMERKSQTETEVDIGEQNEKIA